MCARFDDLTAMHGVDARSSFDGVQSVGNANSGNFLRNLF
jgi:hypothetical protein